jgi:mono/diheme cytochrome c family protein
MRSEDKERRIYSQEKVTMKNVLKASIAALTLALVFSTYTFADGGDTFKAKCAACHGAAGAGDTTMGKNLKLKDLGSPEVQKLSDDELTTIISKGQGKMPAYDGKLTKDQIGDLVKFIRTLKK